MTKDQWEQLTNIWGNPDEGSLETVRQMMDKDLLATDNFIKEIEKRDEQIRQLEQAKIDLNNTNMNLVLRLTDPNVAQPDEVKEPEIPNVDDYDAFYHD